MPENLDLNPWFLPCRWCSGRLHPPTHSGWGSEADRGRQPEPMRVQNQLEPIRSWEHLDSGVLVYLNEEGHEAQSDSSSFSHRFELCPQGHQPGQVHFITVTKVRNLQSSRHGLHHGLVEPCENRIWSSGRKTSEDTANQTGQNRLHLGSQTVVCGLPLVVFSEY